MMYNGKKIVDIIRNQYERPAMEIHYDRVEKETVVTGTTLCDMCPYVTYGRNGERRCYKETFEDCCNEG